MHGEPYKESCDNKKKMEEILSSNSLEVSYCK